MSTSSIKSKGAGCKGPSCAIRAINDSEGEHRWEDGVDDGKGRVEVGGGSAGSLRVSADTSSPTGTVGRHVAGSAAVKRRGAAEVTPHTKTVGA